ncbi:MAG: hypothetical protein DMF12_00865 [Verrucomicrobia bacterium]|nr:MAG: hypothetical protein DMF12_00865 [Verrucomicrobiota bacterium]
MRQSWAVNDLIGFVVNSVRTAPADDAPFHHLRFERVFPDDFYGEMLEAMPVAEDYRAMSGKSKMGSSRPDGKPTRAKIDLFPEYIRHLPPRKRAVWDVASRVLRSKEVESAFVQRLAPGLQRRFGGNFQKVQMYPVPILTRDIPGYRIFKHTDSLWKGITVQFYLPPDNSTPHIGTIFHEVLPTGRKPKKAQMPFSPNTGYAFAVADNTWHSADPVGPEVKTRDSILLTYFVDAGSWRFLRNRGRRIGNLLLNELRNLKHN